MGIKNRLIVMSFLQFFIWGSWLISLGGYLGRGLNFEGGQIGSIFATLGIASLIMPGIIGIIADKWINAERLLGICHLFGAAETERQHQEERGEHEQPLPGEGEGRQTNGQRSRRCWKRSR